MEDKKEQVRDQLSRRELLLSKGLNSFMFDNIDFFVALSRDNTTVDEVDFYPFDNDARDYKFWDKVGQIVGNLVELMVIHIHFVPYPDDDDNRGEARVPDWETLTRILPFLRQKVMLQPNTAGYNAEVEDIRGLARAIHGHPMISDMSSHIPFTFANLGLWCSALATLPSLERVALNLQEPETEEQRVLLNLEPLKELLRTPALRFVSFSRFYFTNELCHATANALEDGSSVTDVIFDHQCTFPDGGSTIIVNALRTNTTVTDVEFYGDCDEPFCDALAAVLLCNSTLDDILFRLPEEGADGRWLCPIFLSLAMNTTLKILTADISNEFGDELCEAIRNGFANNSTLEELTLYNMLPSDGDGAVSARNALSFLRINSTLKSLTVSFAPTQKESYISAFRLEAVKMLENTFLESLKIFEKYGSPIQVEELLALISALQLNTTLKTLGFQSSCFTNICFTVDEVNELVSILKKNYGLERLVPDIPCADDGTVKAILRLNAAGRRYLIKDGSSISKGVEVLSAVSDEIDCVFIHLLENPRLCDRRAADTTTGRQQSSADLTNALVPESESELYHYQAKNVAAD